jgi:hypothetical protein
MDADGIVRTCRRSGNWSDLVELWQTIKHDKQKHAKMLIGHCDSKYRNITFFQ